MDAYMVRPDAAEDPLAWALAPHIDPDYAVLHHYRPRSPPVSIRSPSRRRRPSNKRACVPVSSKAILGLKKVVLVTTDDSEDDEDCAICHKPLSTKHRSLDLRKDHQDAETKKKTTLRAMPCSHIFHQHCIFKWLQRSAACPLCRHQLPTTDDDDEYEDADEEEYSFWFPPPAGEDFEEQERRWIEEQERRRLDQNPISQEDEDVEGFWLTD